MAESDVRHAVLVQQFAGGLTRDLVPIIDGIIADVNEQVLLADLEKRSVLRSLIKQLRDIQTEAYAGYADTLLDSLESFSDIEADFGIDSLNDDISGFVDLDRPAPALIWSAVLAEPLVFPDSNNSIQLKPFIKDWSSREIERVEGILRSGVAMGETNQQITKRIRETVNTTTKRNAETIVRTSTNHVSSSARHAIYDSNDDVVSGYEWISTLDDRTSGQCRSLDGRKFLNKNRGTQFQPKPPIHPNCRSTTGPLFDDGITLRDGSERRPAIGSGGRGTVNAGARYYNWLKRQDAGFIDSVIGPNRGRLLRNGDITGDQFARLSVDSKFRPITLDEMRARNRALFRRAGV